MNNFRKKILYIFCCVSLLTIFIVSATNIKDNTESVLYNTSDNMSFNITATPHRVNDNTAYIQLNISTKGKNNKTFILNNETKIKFNNTNISQINTDNFTYYNGMNKILTLKENNTKSYVTLNISFQENNDQIIVTSSDENTSDIDSISSSPNDEFKLIKTSSAPNTPVYLIISQTLSYYNPNYIKNSGVTHVIINSRCDGITQNRINDFTNAGLYVQFYTACFYDFNNGWDMNFDRAKNRVFNSLDDLNRYNGVDGFVLDYIRSPNAYDNNQHLVSDLIKEVRDRYPNKQLSAFIMPKEVGAEVYGQNIDWIKPNLNNIMIMAYKGNYGKNSDWIKYINSYFYQKVSGSSCTVVSIVQSFRSDRDPSKLSRDELYRDMDKGLYGGTYGTGLFRGGLNNLDPDRPYVPRST
ncbi:MAG: hypothetical protein LBD03_08475 [Methanobrevibacter sp.]|jgi:hypothetical protein|nr:hypothetical protein [Candidatus Methanovirga procula]